MEGNSLSDKRKCERKPLQVESVYTWNGIQCPCHVVDVSMEGIGLRVKGSLIVGDNITVKLGNQEIKALVVRVDGNIVGGKFEKLNDELFNYIMSLKKI